MLSMCVVMIKKVTILSKYLKFEEEEIKAQGMLSAT